MGGPCTYRSSFAGRGSGHQGSAWSAPRCGSGAGGSLLLAMETVAAATRLRLCLSSPRAGISVAGSMGKGALSRLDRESSNHLGVQHRTVDDQGGGRHRGRRGRCRGDLPPPWAGRRFAICGTNEVAAYAEEMLGLRRVVTVPNGSDPEMFSPSPCPGPTHRAVPRSCQRRLDGEQRCPLARLADAPSAAQMLARGTDGAAITFHLLGHGAELRGTAASNITDHGHQPYASLPGWLSAMDVGLALSRGTRRLWLAIEAV